MKTTVILVHGAFADGGGWGNVIPLVEQAGYDVIAVQNPLTSYSDDEAPAWKDFPTRYLVASEDQAINPDLERMFAQRMKATTREVKSSHVPFASNPAVVAEIIVEAAQATAERAASV